MKANNKTALTSGASIGIGYELTRRFAKDRHNLVLASRNQENLEIADEIRKEKPGLNIPSMAKDLLTSLITAPTDTHFFNKAEAENTLATHHTGKTDEVARADYAKAHVQTNMSTILPNQAVKKWSGKYIEEDK